MLLDGNSLAFRAFYALPAENFKTQGGLTTNAVYGFTAMLINLLRDEAPTHVAAAFDVSRQTFRSDRYPEYKANRTATPDEFRGQIEITKEVLVALGITVLAEAGFEADDVIATLATQADAAGFRVLVVTGDRDALQLVTEDVTVLYPRKGVSELTRFTPEAVLEKYGLTPRQYPDFAALRGDPSDNLPGIPGVGEKTASKWIVEYGSLQDLVDNVDSVGGKVGDALRANLSHVVLNRELTDLVRDVPLAQTPDMLRMQPWDRDHIHRLFDDLEFRARRDLAYAQDVEAARESAAFVLEHMPKAPVFWHPHDTLRFAMGEIKGPGLALEFGVAGGTTLAIIADAVAGDRCVVGFDCFTGLPEAWRTGFPAGEFANDPPEIPGARLVTGLFEDTLPTFLAETDEPIVFMHLDADLYSATKAVLDLTEARLAPDAVLVLDEFFNYPGWQLHEFRAWGEFIARTGRTFDYLAYTGNNEQVVVRLH